MMEPPQSPDDLKPLSFSSCTAAPGGFSERAFQSTHHQNIINQWLLIQVRSVISSCSTARALYELWIACDVSQPPVACNVSQLQVACIVSQLKVVCDVSQPWVACNVSQLTAFLHQRLDYNSLLPGMRYSPTFVLASTLVRPCIALKGCILCSNFLCISHKLVHYCINLWSPVV